jgi:hypothetical protein
MGQTVIVNKTYTHEPEKLFNWKNFTIGAAVFAYYKYKEHTNILFRASKASKSMILASLDEIKLTFKDLPSAFKDDLDIALRIVEKTPSEYCNASPLLKHNKKLCLVAVSNNGNLLKFLPSKLKDDKEICFAAVSSNGLALEFAGPMMKKNIQIVLTAIRENIQSSKFADKSVFLDQSILKEIDKSCKEFKTYNEYKAILSEL